MSINFRKTLFLACLAVFLTVTPLVILYSQGYRLDWNSPEGRIKLTQTGGLFFRVSPKQANIFLDSKLTKTTDFFFDSALIENLLPGKYDISIMKEDYHSWEKSLEVQEKMVTATDNVLLIPDDPKLTILTTNVSNFWLSPDNKSLILQEESEENGWSLKLYNLQRKVKSHLIKETDIYSKGADLLSLEFLDDSKKMLLEIGMKEQVKNFILEISKTPAILTETTINEPFLDNILTYKKFDNETYYLDSTGNLFKSDANLENETKLSEAPIDVLPETEYELKKYKDLIFLTENKKLYLFNQDSKIWEKFFEPISDLKLSPDSKKLVYYSNYEIWVLFLENTQTQPLKRAGERVLLMRLSENIRDINWLNSAYLIIATESKIRISEIDERDRINIVDLAQLPSSSIYFNETDKKLYLLNDNNLYQSKELLP